MRDRLSHIVGRDVSRETFDRLLVYERMLREESERQNLISRAGLDDLFERHILDSAQLVPLLGPSAGPMLDIGSGAGLPGLVIAILDPRPIVLIEPRKLRVAFLESVKRALTLDHATVRFGKAQQADGRYSIITARAVANLGTLLGISRGIAAADARFVFPKGKSAPEELAQAQVEWHGRFELVPSQTGQGFIIVADHIKRRGKR